MTFSLAPRIAGDAKASIRVALCKAEGVGMGFVSFSGTFLTRRVRASVVSNESLLRSRFVQSRVKSFLKYDQWDLNGSFLLRRCSRVN